MAKARILKKVMKRPLVCNAKDVDYEGNRYPRYRYVDSTGKMIRFCRVLDSSVPDPIYDYAGADIMRDVRRDARRLDVKDGCPRCRAEVAANLSEPEVMALIW